MTSHINQDARETASPKINGLARPKVVIMKLPEQRPGRRRAFPSFDVRSRPPSLRPSPTINDAPSPPLVLSQHSSLGLSPTCQSLSLSVSPSARFGEMSERGGRHQRRASLPVAFSVDFAADLTGAAKEQAAPPPAPLVSPAPDAQKPAPSSLAPAPARAEASSENKGVHAPN